MFCVNCGTTLPDNANFCLKCGKPQKTDLQVEQSRFETCEIFWDRAPIFFVIELMGFHKSKFWVKAIGIKGVYCAEESPSFFSDYNGPQGNNDAQVRILNELINKLVAKGWQPLTRGEYWYSYKFQRKV